MPDTPLTFEDIMRGWTGGGRGTTGSSLPGWGTTGSRPTGGVQMGLNPQYDSLPMFDATGWQQRLAQELMLGSVPITLGGTGVPDYLTGYGNTGATPSASGNTGATAPADTGGASSGGGDDKKRSLWDKLNGLIANPLFGLLFGSASNILGQYLPDAKAQRDLVKTLADLNDARIPLLEAQTTGQSLQNQQSDIGFRRNVALENSLNPNRQAGANIVADILAGRGPSQMTLNRARGDTRRTIPNLSSVLLNQMLRQRT